MSKWQHRGDVNICEGGYFWKESGFDDSVLRAGSSLERWVQRHCLGRA